MGSCLLPPWSDQDTYGSDSVFRLFLGRVGRHADRRVARCRAAVRHAADGVGESCARRRVHGVGGAGQPVGHRGHQVHGRRDDQQRRRHASAQTPHGHHHTGRTVGAVGRVQTAGQPVVPAARGNRGDDPPDAGREGASARGRGARLDRRHRRGGVRVRVVRCRPDRGLAPQRRERYGDLRTWHPAGAGAGHRGAGLRCAGLCRRTARRAADTDRGVARDRVRE